MEMANTHTAYYVARGGHTGRRGPTASTNQAERRAAKRRARRRARAVFALACLLLAGLLCWGGVTLFGLARQALFTGTGRSAASVNAAGIPTSLLELAERNPEAAEFVQGYPQYLANGGAGAAGEQNAPIALTPGQVPQLLQWDTRWGYEGYGGDFMAVTGCAPTCLSMVGAYLTGDEGFTPLYAAAIAEQGGYYVPGTGTSWAYMTDGAAEMGLHGSEIPLAQGTIDSYLTLGQPIVCSMRPGDFTTAGHFIVIAGFDGEGGYRVHDPNSPARSAQSWSYEQLEGQIKNLWAYSLL